MILIIILYALFALSVVTSKMIFAYSAPIFYIGARMSVAGILLLGYQYLYAHDHFYFKKEHAWLYAQVIFFGVYFTYIIRFWGLEKMPASKTMFMFNLAPFLSALFSYLLINEKMSKKQWVGLVIGFAGFIPILISKSSGEQNLSELFYISWPELAVLASVVSHSYNWLIVRQLVREHNYSPAMINGLTMLGGGIGAMLTSPFFEGFYPVTDSWEFLKLLAFVILISNLICHNLYAHLLKVYTATFISFAGFMSPLFAAFYGWMWLTETITWHFYVSSIIVFVGLVLFYQDELKSIKQTSPEMPEIIE